MKKIGWKTILLTLLIVILFTSFIYNLSELGYLNIYIEQTYIKVYVCSTIFHFLLGICLLKRYHPTFFLFIVCIAPHLIIDAQVLYEGVLVPLRVPFATVFPLLGTALAFVYSKTRTVWFVAATFLVGSFLMLSHWILIPKMGYNYFVNKFPKSSGVLNKEAFKTIAGTDTRIEDTSKKKVLLIEWYFVGCAPCEEKYKALKQLADTFKNQQLDILMVCAGEITNFKTFQKHAIKNAYNGITFLYDADSIARRFCDGGVQSFPMEFLSKRNQPPQPSFVGFENYISELYLDDEIKKIKKFADE